MAFLKRNFFSRTPFIWWLASNTNTWNPYLCYGWLEGVSSLLVIRTCSILYTTKSLSMKICYLNWYIVLLENGVEKRSPLDEFTRIVHGCVNKVDEPSNQLCPSFYYRHCRTDFLSFIPIAPLARWFRSPPCEFILQLSTDRCVHSNCATID